MTSVLWPNVEDVMEKELFSIEEETNAYEAVNIMADKEVWSILVTRKGLPVGVMTERDFIRRCILPGLNPKTTPVGMLMSAPLITIEPEVPIAQALATMINKQIRRLYVVKDGKTIGRVTQTSLVESVIRMLIFPLRPE